jgi:hypothetical protein
MFSHTTILLSNLLFLHRKKKLSKISYVENGSIFRRWGITRDIYENNREHEIESKTYYRLIPQLPEYLYSRMDVVYAPVKNKPGSNAFFQRITLEAGQPFHDSKFVSAPCRKTVRLRRLLL